MQAAYREERRLWERLTEAAQEVDEMHELLAAHKQRTPTVDTVRTDVVSVQRHVATACMSVHRESTSHCLLGSAQSQSPMPVYRMSTLMCRFCTMTSERPLRLTQQLWNQLGDCSMSEQAQQRIEAWE